MKFLDKFVIGLTFGFSTFSSIAAVSKPLLPLEMVISAFEYGSFEDQLTFIAAIDDYDPDLEFLIKSIDPLKDFQKHAINADRIDDIPKYLNIISEFVSRKVSKFSSNKIDKIDSKVDLTRHAYIILFTMRAYNSAARSAARSAAWSAAWYIDKSVARIAGWSAARSAARLAAWSGGRAMADNLATFPGWPNARSAAISVARSAASSAAKSAGSRLSSDLKRFPSWSLPKLPFKILEMEVKSAEKISIAAYRAAEKSSLLYFLKNFDDIVGRSYNSATTKRMENPSENIFESLHSWVEFKCRYFRDLENSSRHFVAPWLIELDRIASLIEEIE